MITFLLSILIYAWGMKIVFSELNFPIFINKFENEINIKYKKLEGIIDYFKMVNERDGGIGGHKINFPTCEFNNTFEELHKCYDKFKINSLAINVQNSKMLDKLLSEFDNDKITLFSFDNENLISKLNK